MKGKSSNRTVIILALNLAFTFIFSASISHADTASLPQLLNYEGTISYRGQAIGGIEVDLTFTFYGDKNKTEKYLTVNQTNVPVSGGVYKVKIGTGKVVPGKVKSISEMLNNSNEIWMQIKLDTDLEISQSQKERFVRLQGLVINVQEAQPEKEPTPSAKELTRQGLVLIVLGLVVVLSFMLIMVFLVGLLVKIDDRSRARAKAARSKPGAAKEEEGKVPEEVVAAIAMAMHERYSSGLAAHSFGPSEKQVQGAWAASGRLRIMNQRTQISMKNR